MGSDTLLVGPHGAAQLNVKAQTSVELLYHFGILFSMQECFLGVFCVREKSHKSRATT